MKGKGGLVLIKSELVWRGAEGGGERGNLQFVHVSYKSFRGDKSDGFGTSIHRYYIVAKTSTESTVADVTFTTLCRHVDKCAMVDGERESDRRETASQHPMRTSNI